MACRSKMLKVRKRLSIQSIAVICPLRARAGLFDSDTFGMTNSSVGGIDEGVLTILADLITKRTGISSMCKHQPNARKRVHVRARRSTKERASSPSTLSWRNRQVSARSMASTIVWEVCPSLRWPVDRTSSYTSERCPRGLRLQSIPGIFRRKELPLATWREPCRV